MKLKPETLAECHEQMAESKPSPPAFFTNYFGQEMVGQQILVAATARSILL